MKSSINSSELSKEPLCPVMDTPKKVLLVDDHPILRTGLKTVIGMTEHFVVAAEAANGSEALLLCHQNQFDLVLLNLDMPQMNGLEALRQLRANGEKARIIMLSSSNSEKDVISALRSGADGYLLKSVPTGEIIQSLDRAVAGELVVSESLLPMITTSLYQRQLKSGGDIILDKLTRREKDILTLIVKGLSNKLIARHLDINENTVKVHVKHLLKKLQMNSRLQAAVWAINQGFNDRVLQH